MLTSSIAASASRRKSLSLIWGSPRSSRWALTIIRRYLETVTPGIATGYWKAMKTPIRERSSGSASVTSSPSKLIVPSVTSRPGWPMIVFASVDLPDPLGPISAWTSPPSTVRSTPLRISLPSAVTCRSLISSSANSPSVFRAVGGGRRRFALRLLSRELDEVRDRGPAEGLRDAALDPRPEQLRRARAPLVDLVRAEHAALALVVEALHRRDRPLERLDDLEHVDLVGGPRRASSRRGRRASR